MGRLSYNIIGLEEFAISFQDYCVSCEWQRRCRYGKAEPFQIHVSCKELTAALDFKKAKAMDKVGQKHPDWDWDQKVGQKHPDWDWDQREAKAKVTKVQIFSKLWTDKVKKHKEESFCLDSRRLDSMLTAQRGEEWWSDFRETMSIIEKECSRIS